MTVHEQKSNNNSNQKMNQSNSNDNSVPAKSPDFFQVITLFKKRKANFKLHATSRTKMRNYISNILYAGVTKEDFYNRNIVFDIYVLLTKKLNPFS